MINRCCVSVSAVSQPPIRLLATAGSDSPNKQTTHSNSANTEPLWQSSKGTSSRSSHPCPWEASAHSLSQPALARDPAGGRTCVSGPASNDEVRASGGPAQAGGGRTGSTMGARGPGGGIASEGTAAPRFNPRSYNPCGALQPYSLQGHAPPPHSPAPATKPQAGGLPGWDQLSMAPASHLPTGGAGTTASSDDAIIPIKAPGENSKVVGEASAGGRCERVGEPCGCGRACESPLPTAISLAPSLDLAPTASSPEGPLLPGGDRDVAETHPRGAGDAPVVDLQPRAGTPSPHWAADRSVSAGSGSFPLSKSARCSVAQMEEEEKDTMVSLKPYLTCVGLRVLEIGAGSGLVGLACAALGAHVVVADRDPISSGVLQRNVEQVRRAGRHVAQRMAWRGVRAPGVTSG